MHCCALSPPLPLSPLTPVLEYFHPSRLCLWAGALIASENCCLFIGPTFLIRVMLLFISLDCDWTFEVSSCNYQSCDDSSVLFSGLGVSQVCEGSTLIRFSLMSWCGSRAGAVMAYQDIPGRVCSFGSNWATTTTSISYHFAWKPEKILKMR